MTAPGEHYQCYKVISGEAPKPEPIEIRDQFGTAKVVLGRPVILCNPSDKKHGSLVFKRKSEKVHLVCYVPVRESDTRRVRSVQIGNQFQRTGMRVGERTMFCVPSSKTLVSSGKQ